MANCVRTGLIGVENGVELPQVVGISLVAESGSATASDNNSHALGVLILHSSAGMTVRRLRAEVSKQVQSIPAHYRFLTSNG